MTVQLRPARRQDAEDFMKLIRMSDQTFLPYLFGNDFETIVRDIFESGNGLFGYTNVRIVEQDGRVAGMLLAYTYEQMKSAIAEFDSVEEQSAAADQESGPENTEKADTNSGQNPEETPGWVNPGEYYLANMAVFPEFRRQGLGRLLLADAETQARNRGCTRLALDVEGENKDAIRLYERIGFVREQRDLNLMGRFSFQRFSKALSS